MTRLADAAKENASPPMFSDAAHSRLRDVVDSPAAADQLRAYFRVDGPMKDRYSGAWFERLSGGGDRAETANRIDAADLVAVTMLSVQVPPLLGAELLHGRLGGKVADLLAGIPDELELADATDADIDANSKASKLWTLLEQPAGMGWVTAGKLLARKRPHLIPVYDNVTRCLLDKPDGQVWERFRNELATSNGLLSRLQELHQAEGLPAAVSSLRVLDVLLWMAHHPEHRTSGSCWS